MLRGRRKCNFIGKSLTLQKNTIIAMERQNKLLSEDIRSILEKARSTAFDSMNVIQIKAYWMIGKRIVEEEQNGATRAQYGKKLIKSLSEELVPEFGSCCSERNLGYFRQFYLCFNDLEILNSRVQNLPWTHIRHTLRVADEAARMWYLKEAAEQNWSVRTLDRNIASQYYYRILQSPSKESVEAEMKALTKDLRSEKTQLIKSPVVAEFLGLPTNMDYSESELEKSILAHIEKFLMELGKGFAFVSRQQHIPTDAGDYYIDLVFYNYYLKCFVLIDLKTKRITHQDVGQMDMYRRMYDDLKRTEGDNPTIGIVLCAETSEDIAKYSVLHDNQNLFASKYLTYMPTEEELRREIERQKEFFLIQHAK